MAKGQLDLKRKEKKVITRLNVDMEVELEDELQLWCRELGRSVKKSRIPAAKVIRLMLQRTLADDEWKAAIAEDVINAVR